jgi:hypothetical protein
MLGKQGKQHMRLTSRFKLLRAPKVTFHVIAPQKIDHLRHLLLRCASAVP